MSCPNCSPENQQEFFAEQEVKCRKEIKQSKVGMAMMVVLLIVVGTPLLFWGGLVPWLLVGAVAVLGVIAFGANVSANTKKLEKLQRERLFGGK